MNTPISSTNRFWVGLVTSPLGKKKNQPERLVFLVEKSTECADNQLVNRLLKSSTDGVAMKIEL